MELNNDYLHKITLGAYFPTIQEVKQMANELMVLRSSPIMPTGRPVPLEFSHQVLGIKS